MLQSGELRTARSDQQPWKHQPIPRDCFLPGPNPLELRSIGVINLHCHQWRVNVEVVHDVPAGAAVCFHAPCAHAREGCICSWTVCYNGYTFVVLGSCVAFACVAKDLQTLWPIYRSDIGTICSYLQYLKEERKRTEKDIGSWFDCFELSNSGII